MSRRHPAKPHVLPPVRGELPNRISNFQSLNPRSTTTAWTNQRNQTRTPNPAAPPASAAANIHGHPTVVHPRTHLISDPATAAALRPGQVEVPPPPPAPTSMQDDDTSDLPSDFDQCPTPEELQEEADHYPRDVIGGCRPKYSPWPCPNCGEVNYPIECLLATLPPLECTSCGMQNHVPFSFNITKLKFNSVELHTPVLDQGARGKCSLFAARGCGNMYQRLESAKVGICDLRQLSEESLLGQYAAVAKCAYLKEPDGQRGKHRTWRMFQAMKSGVSFQSDILGYDFKPKFFKPKKIWTAPKTNFSLLCQLIANGHPMVSSIVGGKRLGKYKPSSIYRAPSLAKAQEKVSYITHSLVLCGGGAKPHKDETERHLIARNSYSEDWGTDGECFIRPKDLIRDPMGMSM